MNTLRSIAFAAITMAVTAAASAQSATGPSTAAAVRGATGNGARRADAKTARVADARTAALEALRKRIDERSTRVSAEEQVRAESQITMDAEEIDRTADAQGEAKVAARLAEEFGTTAEALIYEKQALEATWGNLTIAHTFSANCKIELSVETLVGLKHEGMSWSRIAAGLDLRLGSVVSAIKIEGRVASGLVKPDGKVEPMRGVGARSEATLDATPRPGVPALAAATEERRAP